MLYFAHSYENIKSFTYDRDYNIRITLKNADQEIRVRVFKYFEYITPNTSAVVLDRVHTDLTASNDDFWDLFLDLREFVHARMQECVDLSV